MNTIIEGITYIFKEKNWETKFGYLFLALLVTYAISAAFSFFFQLPIEIAISYFKEIGKDINSLNTLSSLVSTTASIFTLPVILYIYGYLLKTVKNIAEGKGELVPMHNDIKDTFVNGVKLYISIFLASLPLTLISVFLIAFSFGGIFFLMYKSAENGTQLMVGGLIFLTFVATIFISVINSIVKLACGYIYIKTSSFRQSINLKNIFDTIKSLEKPFFKLFFHLLAFEFVQMFAGLFAILLICISFLTIPFVATVGYFAKAYIIGKYYLMFSKIEK